MVANILPLALISLTAASWTTALYSKTPSLVVNTTSGLIKGFVDNDRTSTPLRKWYGVRFGQDTSGANRWRPPQRAKYDSSIYEASAFGPACMQGRSDGGNGTSVQSEDCLRINVIAPLNASGLPVYLYSYGGGFDSGASSDPKIDGSFLAAKNIVFASYNYRLSLWGYPHAAEIAEAKETQNLGLLDTRAAVEWLRDNVEGFGGDPKQITLGGESVGAEMTNQYMSAFSKYPLIRGAIMQSADTNQPMWPLNDQISYISKNLSCPTGKGQLDCLRTKSAAELQTALLSTGKQFQPVTDNITIFKDYVKQTRDGTVAKIPLLIGTNKDEGTLIVEGEPTATDELAYIKSNNLNFPWAEPQKLLQIYPVPSTAFPTAFNATAGMWRDVHMLCLASNLARERTEVLKKPVWRYRFDLVANNLNSRGARIGAFHGSDIRFVMGTTDTIVSSPPFIAVTAFERAVSDLMVEAWTNFIKGMNSPLEENDSHHSVGIADPDLGPRIPGWVEYYANDRTTLAILGLSENKADLGDSFAADSSCKYWNTLLPIFPQVCAHWIP